MRIILITNTKSAIFHIIFYLKVNDININDIVIEDNDSDKYYLLKEYSEKLNFDIYFVENVNSQNAIKLIEKLQPDLGIIMLSKILKGPILKFFPLGILNVHAGILPNYRGVDSRRWAVLTNGDIGCTVHYVNKGIDLGDILYRKKLKIEKGDTIKSISQRNYYKNRYQSLVKAIKLILSGKEKRIIQKKEKGKQYFWMHKELRKIVDEKLEDITYE